MYLHVSTCPHAYLAHTYTHVGIHTHVRASYLLIILPSNHRIFVSPDPCSSSHHLGANATTGRCHAELVLPNSSRRTSTNRQYESFKKGWSDASSAHYRGNCISFGLNVPPLQVVPSFACSVARLSPFHVLSRHDTKSARSYK